MIAVPIATASVLRFRFLSSSRRDHVAWRSRTIRIRCQSTTAATPAKSSLVFLGTPEDRLRSRSADASKSDVAISPQVAASVLARLLDASEQPSSSFQVSAVVSQPPSSRGRGRRAQDLTPTPVAQLAADRGFPPNRILTPDSAKDEAFLATLAQLAPDVCVTAAYGNVLPNKLLAIPRRGTVNIHPSLLPLYRGASPVQRALEDGVRESGVSLAFTVRSMDAGPILAQEMTEVDDSINAPHLLHHLFDIGTSLLLSHLPAILDGSAAPTATPQEEAAATHAAKVRAEEGLLTSLPSAAIVHNKVRAFAGWPGTRLNLVVREEGGGEKEVVVKLLTTRVGHGVGEPPAELGCEVGVRWSGGDCLQLVCEDGSVVEVVELQPVSKKAMGAKAFWNGMRGAQVFVKGKGEADL